MEFLDCSLNNSLNWNLVSAYNTTVIGASGIVDTTIANTYRSVSVEYGMTNGNQSYAGSTLFSPWRDGISKPCYVPYYNGNSCNAIVYIFFNYYGGHVSTFIHSNSSGGNLSIRFKIWAR